MRSTGNRAERRQRQGKAPIEFPPNVREAVLRRSGGRCEAKADLSGCTDRVEHYHHRKLRSQGGLGTKVNCLGVCGPCHTHIHAHPTLAYMRGWLVRGSTQMVD